VTAVDSRVLFLKTLNFDPVQEKAGLKIDYAVLAQQVDKLPSLSYRNPVF